MEFVWNQIAINNYDIVWNQIAINNYGIVWNQIAINNYGIVWNPIVIQNLIFFLAFHGFVFDNHTRPLLLMIAKKTKSRY